MILLVGDYSSVHFELSAALTDKGIEVLLLSDGDAYKEIKADISAPALMKYKNKWISRFVTLCRFTGLFGVKNYFVVKRELDKLCNIEVVQLINPVAIPSLGAIGNILLIRYLRKKASVVSLCALGDDFAWVYSCLNKKYKYSAIDRMMGSGVKGRMAYLYSLKYVYSPLYRFLDKYAKNKSNLIIPGLLDYRLAYRDDSRCIDIIDIPVAYKNFSSPKKSEYPLTVFHAWQKGKELKKGNDILDRMVGRYLSEHGDSKIRYEIVSGVSYDEYLKKYSNADIVLDQIYSYDRGVTGALGMAAGKVVFSGFEKDDFVTGINATPDEEKLYNDFKSVVNSLELVDAIKKSAFEYAEINYNAELVADRYCNAWGLAVKTS